MYRSQPRPAPLLPGAGRRATALARTAGFSQSPIEALVVEGVNRPGLAEEAASGEAVAP